ncbi:MAG: DsrE family protein [Candidatus Thorarchaeota archaeon]|nr:DsrE family protein [Candidatus Thorarchaeota archaeon]
MPSLYIIGQWGPEAAERCYGPFVTGTTAQAQNVDATIFLMMDAVWLMKKGVAEKIKAPGFPPLPELIDTFLEAGGKIEVCSNSATFRKLDEKDLRDSRITIAGAATMIDGILKHDRVIVF